MTPRFTTKSAEAEEPQRLSRRSVLKSASVTAVGASLVGTIPTSSTAQEEIKEVDFRDGSPPVSAGPQGRDEVLFQIHGYTESGESVQEAEVIRDATREFGYEGAVAAVTWDDSGFPGSAEQTARDTGPTFAEWLESYKNENPDTTIRLLSYSMGAALMMEAINAIDGSFTIANADMIGSYARSDSPCAGSGYVDAIESSTIGMYNYWSANDGIARLGSSGASCSASETADNYTDVEVTEFVGGHSGYRGSSGCIELLVENFEEEDGGQPQPLSVSTGKATEVGRESATLSATLESLGDASQVDVAVQYREAGESSWTTTSVEVFTAPGEYSDTVSGLAPETEHEFRGVASDGDTTEQGSVATFVTEEDGGSEQGPSIESFDADSSCFFGCSVNTTWSVSAGDAELATVTSELYGANDDLIDTDETDVSGTQASGSHETSSGWFDDPDRVVLRVTDEAGNTATDQIG